MGTYRVSLVVGFSPALSLAKQETVLRSLEALQPEAVDWSGADCTVRIVADADRPVDATLDAETSVARALFGAGHTMQSAPIVSTSVETL